MRRSLDIILLIALSVSMIAARAQDSSTNGLSLTTQDRIADAGWWPTKGDAPRDGYVGAKTCKGCHGKIAELQAQTSMFHAGALASDAQAFSKREQVSFQQNSFSYSLARLPGQVTLSASDGAKTSTATAGWVFGAGVYGETYVLQEEGRFIESRLSYFTNLDALDVTPGQASLTPHSTDEALGKKLDTATAQKCFRCHTTESMTSNVFNAEKAIPGVTCESCHGPGARHAAAMRGQGSKHDVVAIVNPAHLSPADSVDFCGACHRTWADVAMEMPAGIGVAVVRFQPYRLEKSRCWGKVGDARITCIACHDPHKPLEHDLSAYDARCLACHSTDTHAKSDTAMKTCKVGTGRCASCHMPKVLVPETHATFTDHNIRIVHGSWTKHRQAA